MLKNPGAPSVRVVDYFAQATPPDLTTPGGATLRGPVVERLAGPEAPGQYAQVGQSPQGDPIGQVETLEDAARAQRADGTVVDLQIGTKVYQNDVVITDGGGKVSITFVDGTIFTLASGSRMVLDELVYAPDSEENSAAFSLVEGSFVFIAGQVAKTGDMDVTTPSATMGIRGTTVLVDIQTVQGITTVAVSLNNDPDGGLGQIVISDLDGNEITTITTTNTKWVVPVGDEAYEVERTADELATDSEILADAATAYASSLARLQAGQNFVELDSGSTRSGTSDDNLETGGDTALGDGGDDGGEADTDDQDPEGDAPFPDPGPDPTELDGNTAPVPDDASFDIPEDTRLDGILTAIDPDGDPVTFTLQSGTQNGVVVLLETGDFTFTPTEDYFGADAFTFNTTDGQGGTATAVVTIDVTPVDDPPFAPDASNAGAEDTTIEGILTATDIDSPGTEITYAPADPENPLPAGVTLASDGNYVVDATDPAYQDLAEGQQSGVVFDYTATSGELADTGTVSITVTGTNDAPTLAAASAAADEDGPVVTLNLAALGTDIDSDDDGTTLDYTVTGAPVEGTATISGTTLGFDPGNAFQDLAEGETRDVTIRVTATDAHGATEENDVTVTLTGVNDGAVIGGVTTGAVTEDAAAVLTASGALTITDPDAGEDAFVAQAGTAGSGGFGTFTLAADGNWSYAAANAQAAIQALAAGDTLTDSFTAASADGATQTVTVTLTGVNDGAVIGGVTTGAVTEDAAATLTASGALTITDPDAGEDVFVAQAATAGSGGFGTFTLAADGNWSYAAANAQAAIQALAAGDTLTDSFTAASADGATQTVTVTLTGVNDGAVIGGVT
ncbi:MAG TPA: VCBS domain-containing protein, partial [Roseovarius sp.]|nr:VCBS domain-containing protein [Roseovarius sp.]